MAYGGAAGYTSGASIATPDDLAIALVQAVEAAGKRIYQEARSDRSRRGMGTTSTIAGLMNERLFLGQVGDSREYRTSQEQNAALEGVRAQYPKPFRVRRGSYKYGSFSNSLRAYTIRVYAHKSTLSR